MMKNGKKFWAVMCTFALMVCMLSPTTVAVSEEAETIPVNTFPTTAEVNQIIESEQPLVDAYHELMESFPVSSGEIVYPSYYAGAYIENGVLVVNVTDDAVVPINDDVVVYQTVEYSYNELQEIVEKLISLDISNVTSIGVSDRDNEIHIGINENILSAQQEGLGAIKENIEAIYLEEYYDTGLDEDLPIECFWEEPASLSATTLQGGMAITNSSTGSGFSISICGTYYGDNVSGERAVLTCGHGMTVGNTIRVSGTTLGTVAAKNFTSGERYDWGIIKITNTSGFTSTNRVLNNSNYTTITGISTSNPVGTTICKYGRNGFATGVIIYSDRAVNYTDVGYIHGLVHVTVESQYVGNCGGGDSGGCIYRGHDFYGTYSGDNRDPITATNATKFYYSPVYGVMNFSVQTS